MNEHYLSRLERIAKFERVSPRDYNTGAFKFNDSGEVGTEEDNDRVLLLMRDQLIAAGKTSVQIDFRGGRWRYSNQLWLNGLLDVHLLVARTSIECAHSYTHMFLTPGPFQAYEDHPDASNSSSRRSMINGYKVVTTGAGSLTLQVHEDDVAAAIASDGLKEGPVLIAGFIAQEGGSPPNLQFYEYGYLVSIDGSGLVTLKRPTRYRYASHWPEVTGDAMGDGTALTVGAARIFKLTSRSENAPSSWAGRKLWSEMLRSVRVDGGGSGKFVGLDSNNRLFFNAYDHVVLDDVRVEANLWPVATRSFLAREVTGPDTVEMDKLVERCAFVGGEFGVIGGGTGVKRASFHDVTAQRLGSRADVNDLSVCEVGPPTSASSTFLELGGLCNVRSLTMHTAGDAGGWIITREIWTDAFQTVEIDSVSGEDVQLVEEADFHKIGDYLIRSDAKVIGKVLDATDGTPTTWRVRWGGEAYVAGTESPAAEQTYHWLRAYLFEYDTATSRNGWPSVLPNPYSGLLTLLGPLDVGNFEHVVRFPLRIKSVKVNVLVAGTAGELGFRADSDSSASTARFATIDLSVAGERTITASGISDSAGDDVSSGTPVSGVGIGISHNHALLDGYLHRPKIIVAGLPEDTGDWPQFEIIFECEKLPF